MEVIQFRKKTPPFYERKKMSYIFVIDSGKREINVNGTNALIPEEADCLIINQGEKNAGIAE